MTIMGQRAFNKCGSFENVRVYSYLMILPVIKVAFDRIEIIFHQKRRSEQGAIVNAVT